MYHTPASCTAHVRSSPSHIVPCSSMHMTVVTHCSGHCHMLPKEHQEDNKLLYISHTLRETKVGLPPCDFATLNLFRCTTNTGGHRYSVSFFVAHPLLLHAWQVYCSSSPSVSALVKSSRHSCQQTNSSQPSTISVDQATFEQCVAAEWQKTSNILY